MTKKMEKIVATMQQKMETIAWEYEHKFIDFGELQKSLHREWGQFDEMRTGMFHYNLISDKDFLDTTNKAFDYAQEIIGRYI